MEEREANQRRAGRKFLAAIAIVMALFFGWEYAMSYCRGYGCDSFSAWRSLVAYHWAHTEEEIAAHREADQTRDEDWERRSSEAYEFGPMDQTTCQRFMRDPFRHEEAFIAQVPDMEFEDYGQCQRVTQAISEPESFFTFD